MPINYLKELKANEVKATAAEATASRQILELTKSNGLGLYVCHTGGWRKEKRVSYEGVEKGEVIRGGGERRKGAKAWHYVMCGVCHQRPCYCAVAPDQAHFPGRTWHV